MHPNPNHNPDPPGAPMDPRLYPRSTRLWTVRWIREDGRNAKHKRFSRQSDAEAFHRKLREHGKEAAIFTTPVEWTPSDGPPAHVNRRRREQATPGRLPHPPLRRPSDGRTAPLTTPPRRNP